jgi:hypothetical protein
MAERLAIQDSFVLANENHGTRQTVFPDGLLNEIIDPAKLCGAGEIGGSSNGCHTSRDRKRSSRRKAAYDD